MTEEVCKNEAAFYICQGSEIKPTEEVSVNEGAFYIPQGSEIKPHLLCHLELHTVMTHKAPVGLLYPAGYTLWDNSFPGHTVGMIVLTLGS